MIGLSDVVVSFWELYTGRPLWLWPAADRRTIHTGCIVPPGGAVMSKKKKVRVALRKNRTKPPRGNDLTEQFKEDAGAVGDVSSGERVRAKGDLSRHRTIIQQEEQTATMPEAEADTLPGRVLRVHGLYSFVELDDGRVVRCTVRRLLKSLSTDERSVVTTGDKVRVTEDRGQRTEDRGQRTEDRGQRAEDRGQRTEDREQKTESERDADEHSPSSVPGLLASEPGLLAADFCPPSSVSEGVIERVEPRRGVLTRGSRRREHVIVANVDQLAIVLSLVQPDLKPHLIDRYLALAEKGELSPILCLNKADLADPVELQSLVGAYSQLGIPTVLTSARTGAGIPRLRELMAGRATVFSGQSGVGKSSLLNAIQPDLALRVNTISDNTQKGQHTTTNSTLIRLATGGWVVDTPGVRQLQLWDTAAAEVWEYFRDFRPFAARCGFPDCSHTHEGNCAVRDAVARKHIADRRYQSYLGLFNGVEEE